MAHGPLAVEPTWEISGPHQEQNKRQQRYRAAEKHHLPHGYGIGQKLDQDDHEGEEKRRANAQKNTGGFQNQSNLCLGTIRQPVTQTITGQVDGKDCDQHRKSRKYHDMRSGVQIGFTIQQHRAPLRVWRLHAKPQKAQA